MQSKKVVLSLSGGGVRGIIIAQFLACLEEDLPFPLTHYFDFYGGTSVGGMIVSALVYCKMTASEILNLMLNEQTLEKIMPKSFFDKLFNLIQFWPKYSGRGKQDFLFEYFKKTTFHETDKDLLITAWDIQNKQPLLFKTWDTTLRNVNVYEIVDMATAAPGYYPARKLKVSSERNVYGMDGAIYNNNPVSTVYAQSIKKYGRQTEIVILSICTGDSDAVLSDDEAQSTLSYGGILWFIKEKLMDMIMDGAMEEARDNATTFAEALGHHCIHVNGKIKEIKLDTYDDDVIRYLKEKGKEWYVRYRDKILQHLL